MAVGLNRGQHLSDRPPQGCRGGTSEAEGNAPVGPGTQNLLSVLPVTAGAKWGHGSQ